MMSLLRALRALLQWLWRGRKSNAVVTVSIFAFVAFGVWLLWSAVVWYGAACAGPTYGPWWCVPLRNSPPWTLLTALVTGPALVLTWIWRETHKRQAEAHTAEQLEISRSGQVTERFTRAIEQLGHQERPVRTGAVYALARIMYDSETDHWTIVETLAAYVRECAMPKGMVLKPGAPAKLRLHIDIQAALDVIAQRHTSRDPAGKRVNLRGAYLEGADLQKARLAKAHLEEAQFSGANLMNADLLRAKLERAELKDANLHSATVEGANLYRACLKGAKLNHASLVDANLSSGNLVTATLWETDLRRATLVEANMEGASLTDACLASARLDGANLQRAWLKGADLTGTHLERANLSDAEGLTREQLRKAHLDASTKLPPEFDDLVP